MIRPFTLSLPLVCISITSVWGQALAPVKVEGIVVEFRRDGLLLRDEAGVEYLASTKTPRMHERVLYQNVQDAEISVTGRGLPNHVLAGAFVELEVDLKGRGVAKQAIPGITIFTPHEGTVAGCFRRAERGGFKPEPTPFKEVKEGPWRVVGRLTAVSPKGEIAVAVPGGLIRGRVAENPLIELDIKGDYRFAVPGDRVTMVGVTPKLPFVFATELHIKRGEAPNAIPPKQVAGVEPKDPRNGLGDDKEPQDNDAPPEDEPRGPGRKPLTVLKVN